MEKIENNMLIICPNEQKSKILEKLEQENKLYNLKFMTKKEYLDNYFFTYKDNALLYLMKKYHYKVDVCKVYLNCLYVIDENKVYQNKKLLFLQNLKKELQEQGLLEYNSSFKDYLKGKRKVVLNYPKLDLYERIALETEEIVTKNQKELVVTEYKTMEEEVNGIALKILKLLNEKVSINKIYLTNVTNDYLYTIDRIFSYYKIPINLNIKYPIFGTKIVKDYLQEEKLDLENSNRITKKLVSILNSLIDLKDESKEYKELLISKIKSASVSSEEYKNAVQVKNLENEEFLEDEYVFVLGLNQDNLPKLEKDTDFISDKDKQEVKLYTTDEKNKIAKTSLINIFNSIKNLYLSYKLQSPFQSMYPSSIIEEYKIKVITPEEDTYNFSNLYNKLRLGSKLDTYNRYQEITPMLKELYTHYNIPYQSYNNSFKGINKETYLENLPYPLKLSYTSINTYNECKFKYYLNYVLKLNTFEDTFAAFVGSLYHKILQLYKKTNFDFEKEYQKYLERRELSLKEKVLLVRLKKELLDLLEQEKQQDLIIGYTDEYLEQKIDIPLRKDIEVIFTGTIDKIMYYKKIEDTYFAIVDYKSGTVDTKIEKMKYGLSMQLPVYLYLINYSKVFDNPIFTGIYYQNILFNYPSFDKKSLEEIKKDRIKLQGYSTDDVSILSRFDPTYENSEVIKSMKTTEKGFYHYTKILNDKEVYNMISYTKKEIEKATDEILEADFSINPKIYDGKNISCEFCEFKDICYKSQKDTIYLDKVADLSFLDRRDDNANLDT